MAELISTDTTSAFGTGYGILQRLYFFGPALLASKVRSQIVKGWRSAQARNRSSADSLARSYKGSTLTRLGPPFEADMASRFADTASRPDCLAVDLYVRLRSQHRSSSLADVAASIVASQDATFDFAAVRLFCVRAIGRSLDPNDMCARRSHLPSATYPLCC